MAGPRFIARWDLDKTYLRTDFDTLRDLVRTAIERPDQKRTVPGAAALLRELGRAGVQTHILSGSPEQLRSRIEEKLRLDGVGAVLEARENVVPGLVGDDGPADIGLGLTRRDGRAGDGGAARISNVAEQRAGHGLRAHVGRDEKYKSQHQGQRQADPPGRSPQTATHQCLPPTSSM